MEFIVGLLIVMLALAVPIVLGAICSHLAGKKGRNKVGYFFFGFFFGLIAIIVVLLLEDLNAPKQRRRNKNADDGADDPRYE